MLGSAPGTVTFTSTLLVAVAPLLSVIAFLAISAWALGGDIFRKTLNRYYRAANIVMGLLLIYTAVASLIH